MKKLFLLVAATMLIATSLTQAQTVINAAGIGARFYQGSASFTNQPFSDGDIAYNICYEYRENKNPAFWQVVLGYAPNVDNEQVDSVITPELNLMFEEDHFRAGVGILDSFINYKDIGNDSLFYYHLSFGVKQDLGNLCLALDTLYAFDDWGNLGDFDFADIEYGAWITYKF